MIQFNRYTPADNDPARLAAINARQYLWGQAPLAALPPLPQVKSHFYKQEIVSCLGMELACDYYKLNIEQYHTYLGFLEGGDAHAITLPYIPDGSMIYQPRNSGFFSVIENMIVAAYVARINNKELLIDNTYAWWDYKEPFNDIFRTTFTLVDRLPANPQAVHFESMREFIFTASPTHIDQFSQFKAQMYGKIEREINRYYKDETYNVLDAGLIFMRGGDKLEAETILPPMDLLMKDIAALARRVPRRLVLSDDYVLAERIVDKDNAVKNITPFGHRGYRHRYGEKVSCLPILKNYLALIECEESLACPSANLVNAANWTRYNSTFNFNTINPVYRYVLI
jgi:hypothetical protein